MLFTGNLLMQNRRIDQRKALRGKVLMYQEHHIAADTLSQKLFFRNMLKI